MTFELSTRLSPSKSTKSSIALLTLMFALMTTGCASPTTRSLDVPRSTERCPSLTPLADGKGATVLRKLVEVSRMYHECKAINDAKVDFEEGKHGDNR